MSSTSTSKTNIGIIGIVDKDDDDIWSAMERLAAIGYRGIEDPAFVKAGSIRENVKRLNDLGLQILTVGASREELRDNLKNVVEQAKALGSTRVTVWWSPCSSLADILPDCDLYNRAGRALRDEGITLCYHNHHHEFQSVFGGVYALDLIAANTDPACLSFELDIAWIMFGGEDPASVIRRMSGRVPAIHVKDLYGVSEMGQFTAVGTGMVPIRACVQAATQSGAEWIVVEQDQLRNLTGMETATVSYLNLREMGLI